METPSAVAVERAQRAATEENMQTKKTPS